MGNWSNRAGDNWRPIFAVADMAGGDWPARIRRAADAVTGRARERTASGDHKTMLLMDCRSVFAKADCAFMASKMLDGALHEMEDRPWGDYRGKPLSAQLRGRWLAGFGVQPAKDAGTRGYLRRDFASAWERYGSRPPEAVQAGQAVQGTVNVDAGPAGLAGLDGLKPPAGDDFPDGGLGAGHADGGVENEGPLPPAASTEIPEPTPPAPPADPAGEGDDDELIRLQAEHDRLEQERDQLREDAAERQAIKEENELTRGRTDRAGRGRCADASARDRSRLLSILPPCRSGAGQHGERAEPVPALHERLQGAERRPVTSWTQCWTEHGTLRGEHWRAPTALDERLELMMTLGQATCRALDILEPCLGADRIAETCTARGKQIAWRERDHWVIAFDLEDDANKQHDMLIMVTVGDQAEPAP